MIDEFLHFTVFCEVVGSFKLADSQMLFQSAKFKVDYSNLLCIYILYWLVPLPGTVKFRTPFNFCQQCCQISFF